MIARRISYGVLGLILLLFTLFCFYGMLHSREQGPWSSWFFGYGIAFLNSLAFSYVCFKRAIKKPIA
jgi:hypothetical protein